MENEQRILNLSKENIQKENAMNSLSARNKEYLQTISS